MLRDHAPPMSMVTITDSAIIVEMSGSEYKRQVLNTAINAIAILILGPRRVLLVYSKLLFKRVC